LTEKVHIVVPVRKKPEYMPNGGMQSVRKHIFVSIVANPRQVDYSIAPNANKKGCDKRFFGVYLHQKGGVVLLYGS
jgi:hypothetical protein